jgi:hypothetical protein
MKYLPIVALLLITSPASAQFRHALTGINYKTVILPTGLAFVSGACWGLHEKTMHHWGAFYARFPGANPQYWNPALSWTNKYKNHDPDQGRTGVPVFFTDAKHMLASSSQVFGFAAGCTVFIGRKVSWKEYALRFIGSAVGYTVGNAVTFNLLY